MSFFVFTIDGVIKQLPEKQIYRYMGMREIPRSGELYELVETIKPRFLDTLRCKACYGVVPVKINGNCVDLSVFSVTSAHLARNLRECNDAVLFAATLGMATEQQRRRAAAVSPTEALVLDAMGSAAIEQFCDQFCSELARETPQYKMRPRFSPGYGDIPLEVQRQMLYVLEAQRKVGISMSDGFQMIPQKSVTGVIGLSRNGCEKAVPSCECCENSACEFRL